MSVSTGCRYTEEHEWIRLEGKKAYVGITDYAQNALGDVVFVELPKAGVKLNKGQSFGTVESVKAVSEIYAPVAGTVVSVNEQLSESPELVNQSPLEKAWMIEIEVSDPSHVSALMDAAQYQKFVSEISQ